MFKELEKFEEDRKVARTRKQLEAINNEEREFIKKTYYEVIIERANSEEVKETGSFVYCIPIDIIAWLSNQLSKEKIKIEAGSVVGKDFRRVDMKICAICIEGIKSNISSKDKLIASLNSFIKDIEKSK